MVFTNFKFPVTFFVVFCYAEKIRKQFKINIYTCLTYEKNSILSLPLVIYTRMYFRTNVPIYLHLVLSNICLQKLYNRTVLQITSF